jgi:trimethylamine--corrinoid protein Co-methyltransferase
MVLDNHFARQIEIMARPVPVDEEHLQVELIERVGIGGTYLTQRETRTWTRREYVPIWPPAGETLPEIARREAEDILRNHRPPPMPAGAEKKLETIIARADEELTS